MMVKRGGGQLAPNQFTYNNKTYHLEILKVYPHPRTPHLLVGVLDNNNTQYDLSDLNFTQNGQNTFINNTNNDTITIIASIDGISGETQQSYGVHTREIISSDIEEPCFGVSGSLQDSSNNYHDITTSGAEVIITMIIKNADNEVLSTVITPSFTVP